MFLASPCGEGCVWRGVCVERGVGGVESGWGGEWVGSGWKGGGVEVCDDVDVYVCVHVGVCGWVGGWACVSIRDTLILAYTQHIPTHPFSLSHTHLPSASTPHASTHTMLIVA